MAADGRFAGETTGETDEGGPNRNLGLDMRLGYFLGYRCLRRRAGFVGTSHSQHLGIKRFEALL